MLKSVMEEDRFCALERCQQQLSAEYEERLSRLEERIIEDKLRILELEIQIQTIYDRIVILSRRIGMENGVCDYYSQG